MPINTPSLFFKYYQYSSILQIIYTRPSLIYRHHSTMHTRPSTINTRPCFISRHHNTMHTRLSTVHTRPSTINTQPCFISRHHSTIYTHPSTVHTRPCTINTNPCILVHELSILSKYYQYQTNGQIFNAVTGDFFMCCFWCMYVA